MSLGALGILAVIVFLFGLAVLGDRARRARRDLSPSDHFLAGRELGLLVVFFTLYATQYSGNSLLGFPGEAYRRGFSWVMSAGFMIAVVAMYLTFVPQLRPLSARHRFVTPGDFVRFRFGSPRLALTVAVLQMVALTNFLTAQLMAMGHVTAGLTDGAIPYTAGVLGLAAAILAYETLGGMRAVAWTDALQGLILLVGLGTLLGWLLGQGGGIGGVTVWLLAHRPDAAVVPARAECANWASSIVLLGVGSVVYPQALQRVYAARSATVLRRALAIMAFMPLVTVLVTTLVGVVAIARLEGLGGIAADEVMPRLLRTMMEANPLAAPLVVLVLLGALAAITSTADSVLLSLSSVIAGDVLGGSSTSTSTTRTAKWIAAGLLALTGAIALVPRLTLWRLIELKMELLIQCAPTFILGARYPLLREGPIFTGLLIGTAFALGAVALDVPRIGGVHAGVLGLGANLTVVGIGICAQRRSGEGRAR
jgi:SSS family solute:Na+ symporter